MRNVLDCAVCRFAPRSNLPHLAIHVPKPVQDLRLLLLRDLRFRPFQECVKRIQQVKCDSILTDPDGHVPFGFYQPLEKDPKAQDDVVCLSCVESWSAVLEYQRELVYEMVFLLLGKKVRANMDLYSAVSVWTQDIVGRG